MKSFNNYILEKLHINKDVKIGHLSKEDLEYEFKLLSHNGNSNIAQDIIEYAKKHYNKDKSKKIKDDIEVDKLLYKNGFTQNDKCSIKYDGNVEFNNVYFIKTNINLSGNCIIFDPFLKNVPWYFLVTSAKKLNAKTVEAIEFVEPSEYEKEIHLYDGWEKCKRVFYDNIEDAWKYIENKYGKFNK